MIKSFTSLNYKSYSVANRATYSGPEGTKGKGVIPFYHVPSKIIGFNYELVRNFSSFSVILVSRSAEFNLSIGRLNYRRYITNSDASLELFDQAEKRESEYLPSYFPFDSPKQMLGA